MTDGSPGAPQQSFPDQVTMGLLAYLNAHALDEDYRIAAQRSHPGESPHQRRPIGRYGAAALALFAVFGVTAAVQTSRNEATDERERRDLIAEIESRDADLAEDRDTIRELQAETSKLETQLLRRDDSATAVLDELVLLGVRNGATAVRGPGVRVTVDDAPGGVEDERLRVLDTDLQQLVNGLWQAGAEAITVNRERLTNLSAIRHAGSAITVNFRSISRPYVVEAIGNPDELPARFGETSSGQTWLDLQQSVGLEFNMQVDRSLRLPGVNIRELRFAEPATDAERRDP